jgi:hypothetical protein
MPTVQVTDGSSAVTDSSTVNDGGTVINGGTPASTSPITNNKNPNDFGVELGEYGSQVIANDGTGASTTDPHGIQVVKSGGAGLAYNVDPRAASGSERNFIIRAAGDSAGKVNNVANSVLNTPQADGYSADIVIDTRQLGSASDVAYDVLAVPSTERVPGRTKGTGAGNASTFVNPDDGTAAVKSEIKPNRGVPGELTYHFGGIAKPTTDDYKAKDAFEADSPSSS